MYNPWIMHIICRLYESDHNPHEQQLLALHQVRSSKRKTNKTYKKCNLMTQKDPAPDKKGASAIFFLVVIALLVHATGVSKEAAIMLVQIKVTLFMKK